MVLIRSIATIGAFTMVSRILGFVRDVVVAALLGAGLWADAWIVAFKLPNLFRRLFAEGAFNAAFVPLFAARLERDGAPTARAFSENALGVLLWCLLGVVTVVEVAMPFVIHGFAPGFAAVPGKHELTVSLTRVTFPYLIFISLVSLMGGILNSLGRFAAAAATPILLNLCLIGAVVGLAPFTETPAHALAWGVALAGAVQFLWLLWRCDRAGVRLRLIVPRLDADTRMLLRRMIPLALGAGVYQINLLVDTLIASLLPSGSIAYLFFADRVTQLPLGVIGVAVGTALLPLLTRQLQAGELAAAADNQNRALEFGCLLTLPAAAALMVIPEPVIGVLFEHGEFTTADTRATAGALAVYAAGIPAFVIVKVLAPGFFARQDTAAPVKVAALAMAVNLVLNLALMGPFKHIGIAAATAISAWLNAGLLAVILKRRGHFVADSRLRGRIPRIAVATAAMTALLMAGERLLADALSADRLSEALSLAALVVGGLCAFAGLALLTGATTWAELRDMGRDRRSVEGRSVPAGPDEHRSS
ncbi:MAG TPA: murein biosynthesis integral membrane protein MurJ [Rhodospirillales bacterium]|jgi:putative peptidoglycan lipid II flippase|nr:murein biosynthesis integral membrane protein MurJ [Rhodospirillales bacterium]HJO69940.1 murein biosynthesis integral membrane protein MurJ [Rhodospirillales bacterium]